MHASAEPPRPDDSHHQARPPRAPQRGGASEQRGLAMEKPRQRERTQRRRQAGSALGPPSRRPSRSSPPPCSFTSASSSTLSPTRAAADQETQLNELDVVAVLRRLGHGEPSDDEFGAVAAMVAQPRASLRTWRPGEAVQKRRRCAASCEIRTSSTPSVATASPSMEEEQRPQRRREAHGPRLAPSRSGGGGRGWRPRRAG
jgi:hypothetical protein